MNTDTLIIPLDSHTSELFRQELARPENSRVERASKLAHLVSLDTLRRLSPSELHELRGGTLLHRPLEVFRKHVQRMTNILRDQAATEVLVDALFTTTSPLWVTTLNASRVIIAHCGQGHVIEELANRGCHHHDNLDFTSNALLREIISVIPTSCEVIVARVDHIGVAAFIQNQLSPTLSCEMPQWDATCVVVHRPQNLASPDSLWIALDLLKAHCDFTPFCDSIDFREGYRDLERIILQSQRKDDNSNKELRDKLKSVGEYHEPRVRPVGRRFRYAMGMLIKGRVPWKYAKTTIG